MEDKKEIKTARLKAGGILIVIFILIYVPSLFHWMYGKTISTDIIRMGTLEDSISSDAYIVRNEEVLKAAVGGTCIPEVSEGEKIPVNFSIATVLKKESESLLETLKKKDMEIIKAQKERSKNAYVFSDDVVKLERDIKEKLKLIIMDGNNNSLIKTGRTKDEIDEIIRKKATIVGSTGAADKYVTSLVREKEALQQQIKMSTREIISKSPGIISYVIDGYEDVLKIDGIKDLTPEFLSEIKENRIINNTNIKEIEAGKPFAKVIKDIECYIVVVLDQAKVNKIKVGRYIDVRINEIGKTVDGRIDYISEKKSGKYIAAIKIDKGIGETAAIRKTNIDIILKHYEGYKVPLSSLRKLDLNKSEAEIVLVKANYATVRGVNIKSKDDEFAIISSINEKDKNSVGLYDIYVCKPENIQEGQMINQ